MSSKAGVIENATSISIIIPFRNESNNLKFLFESINKQNFKGEYEIIFINDHSTDESATLVEKFVSNSKNYFLINSSVEGKKKSIQEALKQTKYKKILQLDADVWFDENFFQTAAESGDDYSSGYVKYKQLSGGLNQFQLWENLATMLVTRLTFAISAPIMSNGANSVYKKSGNINLNNKYMSGDDVFLMLDYQSKGGKLSFAPNRIVETFPASNWREFLNQRLRWISKVNGVKKLKYTTVSLLVLIAQISPLSLIFLYSEKLLVLVLFKSFVELIGMIWINNSLKYKGLWKSYLFIVLVYPIYLLSLGLLSIFKKPEWKGRTIK